MGQPAPVGAVPAGGWRVATETLPARVVQGWCEPLTGAHCLVPPTTEVSYVDGGPASRRVRDRLVRCRAAERFH